MQNYFGLKFRTNNSKYQAMGSFKAIILFYTILKSISVLSQERGLPPFQSHQALQNPRQPVYCMELKVMILGDKRKLFRRI